MTQPLQTRNWSHRRIWLPNGLWALWAMNCYWLAKSNVIWACGSREQFWPSVEFHYIYFAGTGNCGWWVCLMKLLLYACCHCMWRFYCHALRPHCRLLWAFRGVWYMVHIACMLIFGFMMTNFKHTSTGLHLFIYDNWSNSTLENGLNFSLCLGVEVVLPILYFHYTVCYFFCEVTHCSLFFFQSPTHEMNPLCSWGHHQLE